MSAPGRTVVYVALGPHRIRAAAQHTAALAADGAAVHLVVADRPESAELSVTPGVSVHRVPATPSKAAASAATRLVAGDLVSPGGADLLIAGDVEALPVAWAAHRRHRDLTVRFEPVGDPARRPAPADLAVVTPWYPSANDPFAGSFVQSAVRVVEGAFDRVSILHTQEWTAPKDSHWSFERLDLAADRFAARWGNAAVEDRPEGELTRVCVPVITSGADYATRVDAHLRRLADALPTGRIEAPLVHAHAGIYGGVVASELARPDARIVVTEHSSFLPRVFGHRASRRRYEQMLDRIDVLMCVSQHLHDLVSQWFPRYRDKLRVVPNVVDFDHFPVRPQPPGDLLRWLYIGRMMAQKGVPLLLDAFARVASEEPRATLTLVGSGPLDDEIRRRIGEPDLAGRVELRAPVPPHQVAGLLHGHDVLVHASRGETFGMTVVEAVATGTPVLVARSQGPAETLAGLDGVAGLMFEVSDDPGEIVESYRDLRKRLSTLDPVRARSSLVSRYGRDPVRDRLLDAYQLTPKADDRSVRAERSPTRRDPRPAPGSAARLLFIAMGPANPYTVKDFVRAMAARGYAIDLVTADRATASRVTDGGPVRVHLVEASEHRNLLLRAEQLLVYRVPGKILATALALSQRWAGLGPELAVRNLRRRYRRVAFLTDRRVFRRGYALVRPLILWRIFRREVLPGLDLSTTGRVVILGASGVATGWRLARRYPELTVTTSMSVTFDD